MTKKIYYFVPIFIIALILTTIITPTVTMSEDISKNIYRLHILANSDNQSDQELKLLVRDAVLHESRKIFADCKSVDDAINASKENIEKLKIVTNKVINDNGYNYKSSVYVTKEYFDTRVYDDFTLPAGVYDSLKIEIGEGKGHNWWCVMFPSVCLSGCTDDLSQTLSDEEMQMIQSGNYVVRFKAVEIYEKIKSRFI